MTTKRPFLNNNEIYHVVIRVIEGTEIFREISDYYRAIFSLYEFNTTVPVVIKLRRRNRLKIKKKFYEKRN